jgi:hypothetical protein
MSKQWFLNAAEVFDAWRIVPRALLVFYWGWVVWIVQDVLTWYQALPSAERTLEASGLAGGVITAVTSLVSWVSKIYMESGRQWTGTTP